MRSLQLLLLLLPAITANELFKAIDADNPAMVNIVLKSGKKGLADEPDSEGRTPLMLAAMNGKHRAFKALLTNGKADAHAVNAQGYSVLDVAAQLGQTKIVQSLITHGVKLSEMHSDGYTPLHRAVMGGHTDTVKALLNAEVPVDEPTSNGETALDLASTLEMAAPSSVGGKRAPPGKSPQLAMKEVLQKFTRSTTLGEKREL